MLIRATIVLLAVLNLGVAAWWLWRPAQPAPVVEQPPGVPRLVLLDEIVPGATDAPVAVPARRATPVAPVPADVARDEPAADPAPPPPPVEEPAPAAADRQPEARTDVPLAGEPRCEGGGETGDTRGWRVYLPPAPDLAAAEATAARIAAAGFSDYLVLRDGAQQNGVALGMFSTEAGAQRRSAALRAAGFAARCARIPASPA